MSACPPYQDIARLTENLCISERTVDNWVKEGRLPRPRLVGGKRLWKWKEVERYIDGETNTAQSSSSSEQEAIRNATRSATSKAL
jgi:predicted DNA-binding transcriptional regulator AlpA